MVKMNILVIDNNEIHRRAAVVQLWEHHNLTVVSSYTQGIEKINEKAFDAILADLFLPAPSTEQGPEGRKFVGQEMPIGIFLGLLAIKMATKYVES